MKYIALLKCYIYIKLFHGNPSFLEKAQVFERIGCQMGSEELTNIVSEFLCCMRILLSGIGVVWKVAFKGNKG